MREELSKLGFSKTETAVYLLLLNLGSALPSVLSRMSGLKRSTVYAALNRLRDKNLISDFKRGKFTYFVVDDPKKILLREKDRFNTAVELIGKLNNFRQDLKTIDVVFYKGVEGYREMYEDILKEEPETVRVWMHLDNFLSGIDSRREAKWTKERVKKKIFAKLLVQNTDSVKELKKKDRINYRETRILSSKSPFSTTCILYSGKTVIFDNEGDTSCICINNANIFQMFLSLFEITWSMAKT